MVVSVCHVMIFGLIHGCIHVFRDNMSHILYVLGLLNYSLVPQTVVNSRMCRDVTSWRRILFFCILGQQLPIQPIHGSSGSIEANCNRPESNLGLLWGLTIGTGYIPLPSFLLNRDAVTYLTACTCIQAKVVRYCSYYFQKWQFWWNH